MNKPIGDKLLQDIPRRVKVSQKSALSRGKIGGRKKEKSNMTKT